MASNTIVELLEVLKSTSADPTTLSNNPLIPTNQEILKFRDDPRAIILTRRVGGSPLDYEASGVIVDTDDWSVVVRPPPNVTPGTPQSTAPSDADVFPIRDGTVVNLYWFGGRWSISTKKSLNLFPNVWVGRKNYSSIFKECLAPYFHQRGAKLADILYTFDKEWSYTIGFAHPEHHPAEKSPSAWLISAYSRADKSLYYGSQLTGFNEPLTILPTYLPMGCTDDVGYDLHVKLQASGPEYYGMVVRPQGGVGGFMYKSSSLVTREKLFYNIIARVPGHQKIKYAVLMSLREPSIAQEFRDAFPRLTPIIQQVKHALNGVAVDVHNRMIIRSEASEGFASDLAKELSKQLTASTDSSVSIIYDILLARLSEARVLQHVMSRMS
jgi:hypothetical protein